MKILVTGNTGYIGPVLIKYLKTKYSEYTYYGYDTGFFLRDLINKYDNQDRLYDTQHWGDLRGFDEKKLDGIDAIIHLAAISNDPMGNKFEEVTIDINYECSIKLAKYAKKHGVKNFVFASSCSVYGSSGSSTKSENDELDPLTAYAKSKINVENDLAELASDEFIITSLRFATACGWSPRLRLDLVLNDFVASAIVSKNIKILSDGSPWRPLIDVSDMSRAIDWAMSRKSSNGGNYLCLNVGSMSWNYKILDLAHAVANEIKDVEVEINQDAAPDKRSYRVDFSLFEKLAPNHQPVMKLEDTVKEIYQNLIRNEFNITNFRSSNFMRLNVLNNLIENNYLDNNLNWK